MPQNPSQSYASHESPINDIGKVVRGQNVSNVLDVSDAEETPPVEDNGQYDYIKEFIDALSPEEMKFVCSYSTDKMSNPQMDEEVAEGSQDNSEEESMESIHEDTDIEEMIPKSKKNKKDRVISMKDFEE